MYKTHRGWLVAGLAAAMLVVPALIGSQTVSAADGDPTAEVVAAADPTAAQADLNAAVQGIIDAVNGADLSTPAGFEAAQAAVGQQSAAMQAATTAGAEMSAVPAELVAQMQAALGKLADAQKQSILQARLNTAVQTIVDAVNNNDLLTSEGYNAASAVAQQQSVAMQEAVDAGAKIEDLSPELQTALKAALQKLSDVQKQSVLQDRLNQAVQTIIDGVNNNDLSTSAGYNAASAIAQQQNTAMAEAVAAGAKLADIPANLQTELKAALQKLSDIQKPMIAQERMNATAQAMVDAVNNADLTTPEGYQAASDAVSQQEQAMADAQAAGATTEAIPPDVYASLESALAKLKAAQPKASVTVHYQDATGKDLKPATTLKDIGLPGNTVDISAQDIDTEVDGYQLQSILHPVVLQENGTDVYLEYIAEPQSVTMHFQDAVSGAQLKAPTTFENVGVTGEVVDLSVQGLDTTVDGYALQSTLNNAYMLKANGNDITLLYLAEPQSVTIHFADATTGKELKAPTTLSNVGLTGESVDLSTKDIDPDIEGYVLFSTLNPAYTLKPSGNDITLLYLAEPQSLTIHFADAITGKELKDSTTLANVGLTGENVDLTTKNIDTSINGYAMQSILNPAYTLKASGNDLTLMYLPESQSVTIHYQDVMTGKEIKAATTLPNIGLTGEIVDLTAQGLDTTINGYDLQTDLSEAYTLMAENNEITLLYNALPQSITIRYQDAVTGKAIRPDATLREVGTTGQIVDLTTRNIGTEVTGYALQSILNDAYTLKAGDNTITLLYLGLPTTMTIYYLDGTTGQELKTPSPLGNVGITGETIDLNSLGLDTAVAGYHLQNALDTAYVLMPSGNAVMLNYVGDPQTLVVHFVVAGTDTKLVDDQIIENFAVTGTMLHLTDVGIHTDIQGYDLASFIDGSYTVMAGVNDVTLEYRGQSQKLIVHFVVAGSEMPLIADQIFEKFGATGDVVDLTTIGIDSVDGFTMLTKLPTDFMVVAGDNEITLEFAKDPDPTPNPGKPTPTPTPTTDNPGNPTPSTDQQHHGDKHGDHHTKINTQATLPQNGDSTNSAATVAGLGIITALLTLMGIDLKKRHV